jgi:hypothetical protein
MKKSHRWAVAAAAAVGLVGVAPAAQATSSGGPVAHTACSYHRIGGQMKCIARGQYCARRYASQYRRYGLSCTKRDAYGRYHLQ